ncbi:MAG: uncharacterized membrane protein YgdD (TMEM256/DUF423 family) [Motiliproteus sp.]|jgi:uncharacterized membrane protein YgdD (TMEM256/DUF423 family)
MNQSHRSARWILLVAALFGAVALVLSASSAHTLKSLVNVEDLARIQTANDYLMYYSLLLLVLGLFCQLRPASGLPRAAALFTTGTSIFCGGLYIISVTKMSSLAWLVPLGGLTLLAGWLQLAWTAWREGETDD